MANILVIDDSALARATTRLALRHDAHEITEATDGVDGVRAALTRHPGVIVLGLHLPALGGLEVMRRLHEAGSTTPFIVLGEPVTEETRAACASLGAVAMLERPVRTDELRRAILRSLSSRAAPAPRRH